MRPIKRCILALALASCAMGQKLDPGKWSLRVEPATAPPGGMVVARLKAVIDPGWHLYSLSTPKGGPVPTTIKLADNPAIERYRILQTEPKRAFDKNFNLDTETYEREVEFLLDATVASSATAGPVTLTAEVRYQMCNDRLCIPPVRKSASADFAVDAKAQAIAFTPPAGYKEFVPGAASKGGSSSATSEGLGAFLLTAFGFGLACIVTPCVFPMIPITMSFFLNKQGITRSQSIAQAGLFCLGIVVLFSGMGLLLTAAVGPFAVVQLGSNPWVNGFISVVFFVFALSLLGAFEITIPSSILTKLNAASEQGGTVGTLLMGLTFSLTSFACVGPFVGTLLAASVQSGGIRPLLGMICFAAGLALPFFFLAVFPSYLSRLPKSGGWMARVKVVLGFLILAAMLKYLSQVDQVLQWNFLTRERFLAAWIVLFSTAGLYLLGFVRLPGIQKDEEMGVGRLLAGVLLMAFAISLVPGMFGAKLGELDAFAPLPSGSAFAGPGGEQLVWAKNNFREALERAKREGKLVFVNFTGYACTNCHWMKANMFTRPEIAGAMKQFILVELYTDGTDEASRANQQLQESKFSTIAIPFYAIFTPDEKVVASFPGLTKDPQEYLAFLNQGAQAKPAVVNAAAPGKPAIEGLEVAKLEGGAFDTKPLAGKVVVLNFWATWCAPCIQEIPSFNKLYQDLGPKGVAVVGVSMDEDGAPLVRKFLRDHPMKYRVALGSDRVAEQFGVKKLPTTIVFDKSGGTIWRFEGFTPADALDVAVKAVL